MRQSMLILGRSILCHSGLLVKGGGVLVQRGKIVQVVEGIEAAKRLARGEGAEVFDPGPGLLTAGLVNAHAHLELTALGGVIPRLPFARWVAELVRARKLLDSSTLSRGLREGADRLVATGTTAVGDNDALGLATGVLQTHPLRARIFRESLDVWDSKRTASAVRAAKAPRRGAATLAFGIGPHAPYTVSTSLARRLVRAARRRRVPTSIHYAESLAEKQWMENGSGPLAALLPPSPRLTSLGYLQGVGLLGARSALIHCNHVRVDEMEVIADSGASVVHCPLSHRFFRRGSFPIQSWVESGVSLALGTDSSASNWDLDMRLEMARLRETHPDLDPRTIWTMATEGGARSLGWGMQIGRIEPGFGADMVQWGFAPRSRLAALEALTMTLPEVQRVMIAGQWSFTAD